MSEIDPESWDQGRRRQAEELAAKAARADELLRRDAEVAELQRAAGALGNMMERAAADDDLWQRLGKPSLVGGALTDEQRIALQAALEIDWASLLNGVGHQPPPPSTALADALRTATAEAIENRNAGNAQSLQTALRELANDLTVLSRTQSSEVPKSRARRLLRRGVRVAKVLVPVVAIAGVGVAVPFLVPALPLIPAYLLGSAVFSGFVADVATGASAVLLGRILGRPRKEGAASGQGDEDPGDRAALTAIDNIHLDKVQEQVSGWESLFAEGGPVKDPDGLLVLETRTLLTRAQAELFVFWSAATGATWYGDKIGRKCDTLSDALQQARSKLLKETGPFDPKSVAEALASIAQALTELQVVAHEAIG